MRRPGVMCSGSSAGGLFESVTPRIVGFGVSHIRSG